MSAKVSLEIAEEPIVFATDCAPEHDFVNEPALEPTLGSLDCVVLLQIFGIVFSAGCTDHSSNHVLWPLSFFVCVCDEFISRIKQ